MRVTLLSDAAGATTPSFRRRFAAPGEQLRRARPNPLRSRTHRYFPSRYGPPEMGFMGTIAAAK
jgi:hypothetical protein